MKLHLLLATMVLAGVTAYAADANTTTWSASGSSTKKANPSSQKARDTLA